MIAAMLTLKNGQAAPRASLPVLPPEEFRDAVVAAVDAGGSIASLFGTPWNGGVGLIAVVADRGEGILKLCATVVDGSFPSLTPACAQAHRFEREILEQWRVVPAGHPWPKPLRFQPPCRAGAVEVQGEPGVMDYFAVGGDEIHEVAVGPVHAGVIEPGHFRFQCHGEKVFHLEFALGYQHRGVERALVGGPDRRTPRYVETLAGDTTVGHATAYAQLVEALGGVEAPPRAQALRAVALELERLANHAGDLGALGGDVAFLPAASYFGRIRGDYLNMTALLCGSRFGRSLVVPGGVAFDLEPERLDALAARLAAAAEDSARTADLLFDAPSVQARFEETGRVPQALAAEIGLVGPAGRASGLPCDVRKDFPAGAYRASPVEVARHGTGDVMSRAKMRRDEMRHSHAFLAAQLRALTAGAVAAPAPAPGPDLVAVSLVEGWRGEICHVALTDRGGRFARYKVVDPSFHNWLGLALAMRGQEISDFPLCNKSFNLSYCGYDL